MLTDLPKVNMRTGALDTVAGMIICDCSFPGDIGSNPQVFLGSSTLVRR